MDKRFNTAPAGDSVKKIRGWLYAVIEAELNKDEEQIDDELIKECSDLDAYLASTEEPLSDEEYKQALQLIQSKVTVVYKDMTDPTAVAPRWKTHWSLRVALVAAAALMLMFSIITVAALSQGRSVTEFVSTGWGELWGSESEDETVTLIKGDTVAEYASTEEAVRALELDIFCPTAMPEGVRVEEIIWTTYGDPDVYEILFMTNKPTHRIQVINKALTDPTELQNATVHERNGVTYYVWSKNGTYRAIGHHNGMEYQVLAWSREDLFTILNGMIQVVQ